MKRDFAVDQQLRSLIPPLSPEEPEQLKENLFAEGCRDPLVVGHIEGQHILLDGHTRYDICSAEQLPFTVVVAPHVTTYPHTEGRLQTAARLASEYNVSRPTIERDGQFAEAVDTLAEVVGEDVRQEILGRESPIAKHDVVALGKLAKTKPEQVKETYTRAALLKQGRSLATVGLRGCGHLLVSSIAYSPGKGLSVLSPTVAIAAVPDLGADLSVSTFLGRQFCGHRV